MAKRLEPVLGGSAQEKIMTLGEELMAKGHAKGLAEGEVMGRAQALLTVVSARGLAVSTDERERIVACSDLKTLDRWLARAASAKSTAEVLADH